MNIWTIWILCLSLAYLLGSIPFGYLLVRIFLKQDIRATGSGNIGATNVARSGAKKLGIATLLLDLGKAFLAVSLVKLIAPLNADLAMMAAVAAIVGHVYPVWLGFRGGKGVASALGVLLALSPATAGVILLVFAGIFAATKYVSLASIVASACVPPLMYHFRPSTSLIFNLGYCFIALLVIVKHHANIGRLLAGTEPRFGTKAVKNSVDEATV